ncbi:hypothetical protein SO802_027519 [Lithocarpus litseifolius]|uniref:Uncharacterized protein n=1 Tax=Lithocarpus litseifolius TaxID=425828 RepID=A0AAW2C5X5_9ROSI
MDPGFVHAKLVTVVGFFNAKAEDMVISIELKALGRCNNPCRVFKTEEYCCDSSITNCKATNYSMFLKGGCPGAYSFPLDDPRSSYTCPSRNNYNVVFCPLGSL